MSASFLYILFLDLDYDSKSAEEIHRELEEVNAKADELRARAEAVRGMQKDRNGHMGRGRGVEEKRSIKGLVEKKPISESSEDMLVKRLDYSFHSETGIS